MHQALTAPVKTDDGVPSVAPPVADAGLLRAPLRGRLAAAERGLAGGEQRV